VSGSSTLEGRVALGTGAGKRVGRAIALELARAGADVVVHVDHFNAEGEEVAAEIRALGRASAVVAADQRAVHLLFESENVGVFLPFDGGYRFGI
jgi:NAD(P)-dependent dehydrogenase (short-subunit alcohol dehydrogenase family)